MQLSQALSFQTQHDLAKLFLCVIQGMSRLQKCYMYLQSLHHPSKIDYLFYLISKNQDTIRSVQLYEFLNFHNTKISGDESILLLVLMGGNVDGISKQEFESYLQSKEIEEDSFAEKESNYAELKVELELTFVKIMEEEIQLERNCDQERLRLQKRWDYQDDALYKTLSGGRLQNNIDYKKIKQFFTRLRQPINDEELLYLIKRFGQDGIITRLTFKCVTATIDEKVRSSLREQPSSIQQSQVKVFSTQKKQQQGLKLLNKESIEKNERYFDRLKRKYLQNSYSQQLNSIQKPQKQRVQSQHISSTKEGVSLPTESSVQYSGLAKSKVFQKQVSFSDMLKQSNVKTPEKRGGLRSSQTSEKKNYKYRHEISKNQGPSVSFINQTKKKNPQKLDSNIAPQMIPSNRDVKVINPIIQPLFSLIRVFISNYDDFVQLMQQIPEQQLNLIQEIQDCENWFEFWKQQGLDPKNISYQELSNILEIFINMNISQQQKSYDQDTLKWIQLVFDQIYNWRLNNHKAKIAFFSYKQCSFIQLFEALDNGQKGFLNNNDIEDLLKHMSIKVSGNQLCQVLFKQLNHYQKSDKITFQNFLKELSP